MVLLKSNPDKPHRDLVGWMKRVITGDGTATYWNEEAKDHYHTLSGAAQEAALKHAQVFSSITNPHPVIFDICFVLGYNSMAALDLFPQSTLICFENDKTILELALGEDPGFRSTALVKRFISSFLEGVPHFEGDGCRITMRFGDAREEIKKQTDRADIVFFDPFSPGRVPWMWTAEFFSLIRKKMNPGAKLTTYSCAGFVRKNMLSAGFLVSDGPIIGRRSPGTIATQPQDTEMQDI